MKLFKKLVFFICLFHNLKIVFLNNVINLFFTRPGTAAVFYEAFIGVLLLFFNINICSYLNFFFSTDFSIVAICKSSVNKQQ